MLRRKTNRLDTFSLLVLVLVSKTPEPDRHTTHISNDLLFEYFDMIADTMKPLNISEDACVCACRVEVTSNDSVSSTFQQASNQFILQSARLIKSGVEHQFFGRTYAETSVQSRLGASQPLAQICFSTLWRRGRSNTLCFIAITSAIKRRSHAC